MIPTISQYHVDILEHLDRQKLSAEGLPPYAATAPGVIEAVRGPHGATIYDRLNRLTEAGLLKVVRGHVTGAPSENRTVIHRAFLITKAGRRYLDVIHELWPAEPKEASS